MVNEGYTNKQIMEISGAGDSAVRRWKKQYLDELNGNTPQNNQALTTEQQNNRTTENTKLREVHWRAKRDNEILKKASSDYQTTELCTLFNIALSTHYYQINKQMSHEERETIEQIKSIAVESQHSYGKRRIQVELANKGIEIGVYKTASLMKKANVIAIKPKKRHSYPSGEIHKKADHLFKRRFNPETIHTHWVGDITYIKLIQVGAIWPVYLILGQEK